MSGFRVQTIIDVLTPLLRCEAFEAELLDDAIDALEEVKATIADEDESLVDKVDEIQDYLQYLLAIENPAVSEMKDELAAMLDDLQ